MLDCLVASISTVHRPFTEVSEFSDIHQPKPLELGPVFQPAFFRASPSNAVHINRVVSFWRSQFFMGAEQNLTNLRIQCIIEGDIRKSARQWSKTSKILACFFLIIHEIAYCYSHFRQPRIQLNVTLQC